MGIPRYEKKFGTLLEDMLGIKVYARVHWPGHQLEKFKRLFGRGITPKLVVVNVVSNDMNNDFFPHTDIVGLWLKI